MPMWDETEARKHGVTFEEIEEAVKAAKAASAEAAPYLRAKMEANQRVNDLMDRLTPEAQTEFGGWLRERGGV